MKTKITKMVLCLFVVLATIACKKEEVTPTTPGTGTGLTPSASNTTFEQTMTVQINGTTWLADREIEGTTLYSSLFESYTTTIKGIKNTSSPDDESIVLLMSNAPNVGMYSIKDNAGICNIIYNDKSYSFDYLSPTSNKSRMNIEIVNTVQSPSNSNLKYIAANFTGTAYNVLSSADSIIINGNIRFK